MRYSVTMSVLAYDVLWAATGLEDKHLALLSPSPGATYDERRDYERRAWAELNQLDLARGDQPDPDVLDALALLVRGQQEVFAWYTTESEQRLPHSAVVAVASGHDGVVAQLTGDTFHIGPARPTGLADALLSVLPSNPPAVTPSLTFPLHQLTGGSPQRRDDYGGSYMSTVDNRSGSDQVRRARELLTKPRRGGGHLHAASRDRFGRRTVSPQKVTYIDTDEGRLALLEQPPRNGETWATVTPGGPRVLAQALGRLLADTAHGRE